MARLAENRYGKSRVRLVKVTREGGRHEMKEWSVGVYFEGDFETCFTLGDNSSILPTDTMKNTVYYVAKQSSAACIEDFARELVEFLLGRNPQAMRVDVEVEEKIWRHVVVDGKPHPTTFQQIGPEVRTAKVGRGQESGAMVQSGVKGWVILKTAKSGFADYMKDSLTTLPETRDRLFGTEAQVEWTYAGMAKNFAGLREKVMASLEASFAEHDSLSVQHTLYAMAKDALAAVRPLAEITLTMPNRHCILVDLARFGQQNANEIFAPIDEPHGYIEARVTRE